MRIPVIAYMPSETSLLESAIGARRGEPGSIPEELIGPSGFEIDRDYPAVPVGAGTSVLESVAGLAPENSENFAVRGTIEAATPEDVPTEVGGVPLFADPEISPFNTCPGDPAVGAESDVALNLKLSALHEAGLDGDGVAVAVLDTGINLQYLRSKLGRTPRNDPSNSWTPLGVTAAPFQHPTGHGTMCAYNVLLGAPNATLLDFPILRGSTPSGAVTGQTLSVALLAYSQLLAFWAVAFAPSGGLRYKALVVNNSWGIYHPSWDFPRGHPGRYIDNPMHPFNVIASTLANSNADILFAAGNCGANCPSSKCQGNVTSSIMGANALEAVLTLAGCDINDARVGYSSQGPAITGMAQMKPDVAAYTHFLGSEALGAGQPDTGTSTACPVASGVVAALRTASQIAPKIVPPFSLFSSLRTNARQVQGTGWNGDYGFGIINPVSTAQSLGVPV